MIRPAIARTSPAPAALRLSRLAPLSDADLRDLDAAVQQGRLTRARHELVREGQEFGGAQLMLSGWAARTRILPDGRRQFLSMLLPGDMIGLCHQSRPLAVSSVVALTDLITCAAPAATASPTLREAYAVSHAMEEAYLLDHITRLGRMNAEERIASVFLELHERLSLAGLVTDNGFELPLTQEMLGDALGLTAVHVNRMLQLMRRDGDIRLKNGRLVLPHAAALAEKVGRAAVRVSTNIVV